MTNIWIDAFIRLFTTLGFITGGVVIIAKYFKYLEVKASEKSLGATKIKEFEKADLEFRTEINRLTEDNSELKKMYEKVIDKVWELMGKK